MIKEKIFFFFTNGIVYLSTVVNSQDTPMELLLENTVKMKISIKNPITLHLLVDATYQCKKQRNICEEFNFRKIHHLLQ